MDIDLLSKMVKELILDDDRVVLPGLGSFVAEIVPSTFSDKGYTINPPYRRLFFRSKPDDGNELARFYAETNNVEIAVAERIMKDFISELRNLLYSRKTVVFPGLGRLRATKENNIFFVADEDLDIYPAGFGLEPISLKTHEETGEEVSAAVEGLKQILNEQESVLEPEPAIGPIPVEEPELSDVVVPVPAPVEEPEPAELVTEPEPSPVVAEPEVLPEPVAKPAGPSEVLPDVAGKKKKSTGRVLLAVSCYILAVVALLLVALAVAGRVSPEWVDGFLYSPEELKILNHKL